MNIFERLKQGEPIHMIHEPEYHAIAHKEMDRCRKLCFQINHTLPERAEIYPLEQELFTAGLSEKSYFTPPFQIDYANQVEILGTVFANHDLTMMSAGGVILEDGVMIGEGAVIGSASVVTKDVEPHTVVAGNPAKVIK